MKVLIIKLGALGDIILATPIIKKIQAHHTGDKINLLTTPPFRSVFKNWPNLQIHSFSRKGIINTCKTLAWIRSQKFDRVYDLQSNDRSTLLCALSSIPHRIGNHPRFPYHSHPENKFQGECHTFDRLNQIIKSVGITPAKPVPFLPIAETAIDRIKLWIKDHHLQEQPFIILHAGSSRWHLKKRWPHFPELGKHLIKLGFQLIWIGSHDDQELNSQLSQVCGIDATSAFDIPQLIELGKRAHFAVTNDSAPMHLLSCSKIPIFGLFGPTNPKRTHALGQRNRVISLSNQYPENDTMFQPENINKITPDMVIAKIRDEGLLSSVEH